ncbi:MAG: exopolysaccharide biosynthesis polyprenyl glycosylphosphotransferase, partial [Muribaculaceae bacterium]|nr:exopolysaccharide biosynthesis polyprenyl glycosylphosphotransferase [Muribaculaceae bacterium]
GTMPVAAARPNPLSRISNRIIKRLFDVVVSSIFLIFFPLILIPVAIAIKISSPGPIFFKQKRTGFMGEEFNCWKFRTMRVNKDADKKQATKDDSRKTKVGTFLRKTSIDELPQFINVWLGDMSIVGPRPHMLTHTEQYARLIDQYMVRHFIKPGITGWAQVNGYRGQTEELWQMEKRVEYDVWYIENWNFFLDIKIMVKTIINAVKGEENAF